MWLQITEFFFKDWVEFHCGYKLHIPSLNSLSRHLDKIPDTETTYFKHNIVMLTSALVDK